MIPRHFAPALVIAASLHAVPATAQNADPLGIVRGIENAARSYAVFLLRSAIDFTYDTITIDPRSGAMIATGLTFYPILDWDEDGTCTITVTQAIIGSTASADTFSSLVEATDVAVGTSCLDPSASGFLAQHGYEGSIVSDAAMIDFSYDLPSAGASFTFNAAIADAAEVTVTAEFDYLAVTGLFDDGEPDPDNLYPVAHLTHAEVSISNLGAFERFEPTLSGMIGSVKAVPDMAAGQLEQLLTEGGSKSLSNPEQDFLDDLREELDRFVTEKSTITITASPVDGVWLDEDSFETPNDTIKALQPRVGTNPASFSAILSPDTLSAALDGGNDLDDDARLSAGRALVTGIGAPRDVVAGRKLLESMAEDGNAEAAYLVAQSAVASGDDPAGYRMALLALAGGHKAAARIADALERDMDVADILSIQTEAADNYADKDALEDRVDGIMDAPTLSAMRKMARDAYLGRSVPRSYETAYFWATVAAAAGDKSAATLRDRIDQRMGGTEAQSWIEASQRASSAALAAWASDGLAAAFFDQYGMRR